MEYNKIKDLCYKRGGQSTAVILAMHTTERCKLIRDELVNMKSESEPSSEIRKRVVKARKIQARRYEKEGILTNSELSGKQIKVYCK